jgi:hypothetical protein
MNIEVGFSFQTTPCGQGVFKGVRYVWDIIVGLLKYNGHIILVGQCLLVSKAQRVRLEFRGPNSI